MTVLEQLTKDFDLSFDQSKKLDAELAKITCYTWQGITPALEVLFSFISDKDQFRDDLHPDYKIVRQYLKFTKIRYTSQDSCEYADNFNRLRGVIGIKTLSKNEGININQALIEISDLSGVQFDISCNDQYCFTQLYDYLTNIPSQFDCFVKFLQLNYLDIPAQLEKEKNKIEFQINPNKKFNSIEIKFNKNPGEKVIALLKSLKFRYNTKKYLWYGFTPENILRVALSEYI